jgi:hypothetical protein
MKKRTLVCFGLLALLVVLGPAAQVVPVAVSPGRTGGMAVVGELCPTFSWTSVDWAVGYRVAVFEALGVGAVSYEQMTSAGTEPVLSREIEGRGLSWTPSSEEGLRTGGMYVWYVEAKSPSGPGAWSAGRVFIVDAGAIGTGTEERVTRILREKGIREEVITNVLKEIKSGMTGAVAGEVGSKPQGDVRAMGTEGETNTLYGLEAGDSITSGSLNTFIGRSAGTSNTSGSFNTFLGYSAGYSNTTGNTKTFLGYSAGYSNTTGSDNTFLGLNAGAANTTGSTNTFLGLNAGLSNTTGEFNTFLGKGAGAQNTTGTTNTFIGLSSGYSNTTGEFNLFLGHAAGSSNTIGSTNTFLGHAAGSQNTTGNYNTFFGNAAGLSNTTGSTNTFIGLYAGSQNTTGNYNVFLGNRAGYNETGSNKLYIDNSNTSSPLIYGEFDNDILAVNGKFAVGTKSPTYPMELKTTGRNATFVLQRDDGGAINFVNATPAYGQFGTGNNYPVRILVNQTWKMSLNTDNSLTMVSGATCTAGGVWTNASSRELKENIEGLSAEEAEGALAELAPVKYVYKADKAERHVGFIAEDVPALVASKDRKTLSSMDVVAVLTKVVQEQQKTIAELKDKVAALERKGKLEK